MSAKVYVGSVNVITWLLIPVLGETKLIVAFVPCINSNLSWNTTDETLNQVSLSAAAYACTLQFCCLHQVSIDLDMCFRL